MLFIMGFVSFSSVIRGSSCLVLTAVVDRGGMARLRRED